MTFIFQAWRDRPRQLTAPNGLVCETYKPQRYAILEYRTEPAVMARLLHMTDDAQRARRLVGRYATEFISTTARYCVLDTATSVIVDDRKASTTSPAGPNVRNTDPETSAEAAALHPEVRLTDRDRALAALRSAGDDGLTDYELAAAIGRQQNSAGKRRGELVAAGLAEFAGTWRNAPSGARCRVWRALP